MKNIWAPWRIQYINSKKSKSCLFCFSTKRKNYKRKNLILCESNHALVMMNRYPYTAGHVMVVPKRHHKDLDELSEEEFIDFFQLVRFAEGALKKAIKPDGFNIGVNLGTVAGAGEARHLHFHIVARWQGDNNFMPVIGKSQVISEYLDETYEKLLTYFQQKQ